MKKLILILLLSSPLMAQVTVKGTITLGGNVGGTFNPLTGDATSTSTGGATEVIGLLNHTLPSLTTGYLNWNGSAWVLSSVSGSGTVTSFSAGNLSPLFTTSVATATTTPALTFTLSTAAANTVFGNFTGSTAAPTFSASPVFSAASLTNFPTFNQNTTGTAGGLTGCTISTAGSICYWNGSAWTVLAGNTTTTNYLQETSAGVPSWTSPGGGVSSVSNSDGTLTISPTTGAVVASIALGHGNTWTGTQTFVAPALGTPASGVITNLTGTCTSCVANTSTVKGSSSAFGIVEVDNTTITASGGVISAVGGSGTVTHTAGALTAKQLVIGNGSADITVDPDAETDGSGNLTATTVTTPGDGTHPGALYFVGNTTNPTIPANNFGIAGFTSTSATAYGWQPSTTAPSGTQFMMAGTPSSGWSSVTYATAGTGVTTALAVNTGSAGAVGVLLATGTAAMNTAAVGSGSCETVVTVSASGVATTDVIEVGFNGDPTAVTGYGASATGAVLTIYPYPSSGNVNFKVCNSTANSITPSALTLNWKVYR